MTQLIPYLNKGGDSGITQYIVGNDHIKVKFTGQADLYLYNYAHIGEMHVEKMKQLAALGRGLSTYISQHPEVRNGFVKG